MSEWLKIVKKHAKLNPGKSLKEYLPDAQVEYKKLKQSGKVVLKSVIGKTKHHKKRKGKSHTKKQRGGRKSTSGTDADADDDADGDYAYEDVEMTDANENGDATYGDGNYKDDVEMTDTDENGDATYGVEDVEMTDADDMPVGSPVLQRQNATYGDDENEEPEQSGGNSGYHASIMMRGRTRAGGKGKRGGGWGAKKGGKRRTRKGGRKASRRGGKASRRGGKASRRGGRRGGTKPSAFDVSTSQMLASAPLAIARSRGRSAAGRRIKYSTKRPKSKKSIRSDIININLK